MKIKVNYRLYMRLASFSFSRNRLVSRFFAWVVTHLYTCIPSFRMQKPVSIAHLIEDVYAAPKGKKGFIGEIKPIFNSKGKS